MKLDKVAGSKNDEWYTPAYAVNPIIKYLPQPTESRTYKVWCPFDTENSFFVKVLREKGYHVVATHISMGCDFFQTYLPLCDFIISNPPYSRKGDILERLFYLDKPFAMLVGVVGLFESKQRFEMFKNNQFEIMYLSKRVKYMKEQNEKKPSLSPPFSSVYVCHKLLPEKIMFEEI